MRALWLIFGLVGSIAACKVYDPGLVQNAACDSITVPARPDVEDGDDVGEITFALRDVLLQQGNDWQEIGYNLDNLCTTEEDPIVECMPPNDTVPPEVDGNGGIDNAFGSKLFPTVALVLTEFEAEARAAQAAGNGALIVHVQGWNGQDNDPRIDAIVSQTVDGVPANGDGSQPNVHFNDNYELVDESEQLAPPPAWDGNDYFWVREDTFLGSDAERPLIRDDNAYVTNRTAVVRLADRVDIVFFAGEQSVTVRLTDAHATGRLSEDGNTLEDVIVSGRWAIIDLLATANQIGVCEGSSEYDILLEQLNRIADVRSRRGTGGIGIPCDAISVGTRFRGVRANWVDLAPGPAVPNGCSI